MKADLSYEGRLRRVIRSPPPWPSDTHQNMTFRYVPQRIAPQPPSGGDSQDSGIVQSGSPHSTRTTNGRRVNTATAMAVRPTTLENKPVAKQKQGGEKQGWSAGEHSVFNILRVGFRPGFSVFRRLALECTPTSSHCTTIAARSRARGNILQLTQGGGGTKEIGKNCPPE